MQVRSLFFDKKIFSDRESHASERGSKHLQNSCVWTIFSFGFSRLAKERDHDTKRKLILIFPEKFTLLLYISFLTSRSFSCFFFAKKERNGHFLIYLVFLLVSHVNICPPLFFLILWFSRQKKKNNEKTKENEFVFRDLDSCLSTFFFGWGCFETLKRTPPIFTHTHKWGELNLLRSLLLTTYNYTFHCWKVPVLTWTFYSSPLKNKNVHFYLPEKKRLFGVHLSQKKKGATWLVWKVGGIERERKKKRDVSPHVAGRIAGGHVFFFASPFQKMGRRRRRKGWKNLCTSGWMQLACAFRVGSSAFLNSLSVFGCFNIYTRTSDFSFFNIQTEPFFPSSSSSSFRSLFFFLYIFLVKKKK